MRNITLKKTLFAGLSLALCGLGTSVHAHTGIQHQINDTARNYNSVVIGHGCPHPGNPERRLPVRAQSVLFPTVNPYFTVDNVENPTLKLEDFTNLSTLANWPRLIQDNNVFRRQRVKLDANGNVIGFEGFNGNLDPTPPAPLIGLIPFRTNPISFKETEIAGSCVQRLQIKIAIADVCRNAFPPNENTAGMWIPNTTPKFPSEQNRASSVPRSGAPATLTINNPNCAEGATVVMWPSNQDVDANLPIQGRWGR